MAGSGQLNGALASLWDIDSGRTEFTVLAGSKATLRRARTVVATGRNDAGIAGETQI
jgi:hypothetical protein